MAVPRHPFVLQPLWGSVQMGSMGVDLVGVLPGTGRRIAMMSGLPA